MSMPLPGLSLMGFMDEEDGLAYQREYCILEDASDDALRRHHLTARERLGPPTRRAGYPEIRSLPSSHNTYVSQLRTSPIYVDLTEKQGASVKVVEIAPLLACQFHVHTVQEKSPASRLSHVPSMREMLEACLPTALEQISCNVNSAGGQIRITSSSLNLMLTPMKKPIHGTLAGTPISWIGIPFGPASPFALVVRFEGRCYLKNGFHRMYQIGKRGVKHMPCLFMEASSYEDAVPQGAVFPRQLLESDNPPTCGHFVSGHAYPVTLQARRRLIQIDVRMDQESAEE